MDNPIIVGLSLLSLIMLALAAFQSKDDNDEAARSLGIGLIATGIVLGIIVIAGIVRFVQWVF